jgi:hypothetical protein
MELLGSQYNASTNLLSFGTGRAKVRFSLVKKIRPPMGKIIKTPWVGMENMPRAKIKLY